jgi:hypothetical protein
MALIIVAAIVSLTLTGVVVGRLRKSEAFRLRLRALDGSLAADSGKLTATTVSAPIAFAIEPVDDKGEPALVRDIRWAVQPARSRLKIGRDGRLAEFLPEHPGTVVISVSGITVSGHILRETISIVVAAPSAGERRKLNDRRKVPRGRTGFSTTKR